MLLLAATSVAACADIPTGPPAWVQKWVLPGEAIEVHVAEFLPDGVTLNDAGTLFRTTTESVSVSHSLAEMCPACAGLDGLMVPKPEFSDTLHSSTTLPAALVEALLAGGALSVAMSHNMDFDPLRPSADPTAETGYLVLVVSSNGQQVARDSIDGADTAFPAGATLVPALPIQAGPVTNLLEMEVRIFSPAGDLTMIEEGDTLGVTLAPSVIDISQATIQATAIELIPTSETIESGGVDSTMVERIQGGALRFDIVNPFNVAGELRMTFDIPGRSPFTRSVTLQPGTFHRRMSLSGDELRSLLLAETATITTSGDLASPGGVLTLTPTQQMTLETSFELDILIGGEEGGQ